MFLKANISLEVVGEQIVVGFTEPVQKWVGVETIRFSRGEFSVKYCL